MYSLDQDCRIVHDKTQCEPIFYHTTFRPLMPTDRPHKFQSNMQIESAYSRRGLETGNENGKPLYILTNKKLTDITRHMFVSCFTYPFHLNEHIC